MSNGAVSMATDENAVTEEQQAHDKQMAEKFDNQSAAGGDESADNGNNVAQRPDNIPEKFWDAETGTVKAEELAKSYQELEKKLSTGKESEDNTNNQANDEGENNSESEQDALDYDRMTDEYVENGELSEQSMKELEAAGISSDMVQDYIAGQEAIVALRENAAFQEAGGEDQFRAMQDWAKGNLSEADITAFDEGVSGTQDEMLSAVRDLKAKYVKANGSEGNIVQGNGQKDVTGSYQSMEQMKADMKDPRYKTDPAFRSQVEAKLARSNIM